MKNSFPLSQKIIWCASAFLLLPLFAKASEFGNQVRTFLTDHCVECHDAKTTKGNLNLDTILWNPGDQTNAENWTKVIDRVTLGEMPPKKKARPPLALTQAVITGLGQRLQAHQLDQFAKEGRAHRRRMNRLEYQNTLRDLMAIPELHVTELLPEDSTADGFDTADTALPLSPVHIEKYFAAVDRALETAWGPKDKPEVKNIHIDLRDVPSIKKSLEAPRSIRSLPDGVGFFVSKGDGSKWDLSDAFQAPVSGHYKIKISGYGWHTDRKPGRLMVSAGLPGVAGKSYHLGYYEFPADKPTVAESEVFIEAAGDTIKTSAYGLPGGLLKDSSKHDGPAVAIQWIEIEGPLEVKDWPPASRVAILDNVDPARGSQRDAINIVKNFAIRAFRRPIPQEDLAPYLEFVTSRFKAGEKFEAAVKAGIKAVLVSPRFIQLDSNPGPLDKYALASRLSYFLWSTMPDEALFDAVVTGEITKPEKLREQVARMLADPKARAFTENFAGQWLGIRNLDDAAPDPKLYPEFDSWLKVSMKLETNAFFEEMIRSDIPTTAFIHSNFGMLNERLAKHYGIPDVLGPEIRRVNLLPEWKRGGVITQGSVLMVTSDGTNTSPVLRGAWMLDRIFGKPVPPPPGNIPPLDPDNRGIKTVREELTKHKALETCATCHSKLDPLGFALETYDAIGGWRDRYRINPEKGKKAETMEVITSTVPQKVSLGAFVDTADSLPDGRTFASPYEFKRLLLAQPEPIVRAVTQKLVVYGTGHRIEYADRAIINDIVTRTKASQYGFRSLIQEIVQSPLFLNK